MRKLAVFRVAAVHMELPFPVLSPDGGSALIQGYYRTYLVKAADQGEAVEVIRLEAEREGVKLLGWESPIQASTKSLPPVLLARAILQMRSGVFWRSGRVFYEPDA